LQKLFPVAIFNILFLLNIISESIITSVDGLSMKSKLIMSEMPRASNCSTTLERLHLENENTVTLILLASGVE
jgi:hypothetical protein